MVLYVVVQCDRPNSACCLTVLNLVLSWFWFCCLPLSAGPSTRWFPVAGSAFPRVALFPGVAPLVLVGSLYGRCNSKIGSYQ